MPRSGVGTALGTLARVALGAILLVAALVKTGDPSLFVEQIRDYDITPASWAPMLAHVFLLIETALGVALIIGWRPRLTIPAAGGLLVLFMLSIAAAWSRGYTGSCGCFGSHGLFSGPGGALIEDTGFLALAVIAFLTVRHRAGNAAWQRGLVGLAALFGIVAPLVAPSLPIDCMVTDASAGTAFDDIVVEGYDGDVHHGAHLVALLDPYGAPSAAAVEALNALAGADLHVLGIVQGTNDDLVAFMLEQGATFDLGHAPEAALRRFYRRLPVFLELRDGVIERAWFDAPPDAATLAVTP